MSSHPPTLKTRGAHFSLNCGPIKSKSVEKEFYKLLDKLPQSKSRLDVGQLADEFEIKLKPGSEPVFTAQYPSAHVWSEEIRRQCIDLWDAGFISRSASDFQSAILFVPKPDGTWRTLLVLLLMIAGTNAQSTGQHRPRILRRHANG